MGILSSRFHLMEYMHKEFVEGESDDVKIEGSPDSRGKFSESVQLSLSLSQRLSNGGGVV